ncbi:MAG: hypothetical protein PHN18_11485 [Sulfurospirillaceae bacterium]|nr:hypothetical protein [Sulfurospirillaceae bacterium]MDD2826466.1 hypothetical protein [Sulfurospirillaceae bacterium]
MIFKFLITVLLGILLLGCEKKEEPKKPLHVKPIPEVVVDIQEAQKKELRIIDTNEYLEEYILNVINHGSDGSLGYPGGAMDAGIATKEDAPNIARYVVSLSGKKSSDDAKGQKAQMFYTSNCGGCHGNDGKGLNGAFPDLTQKSFKGIEKRKAYLKAQQP